ncbi:FAD-binding oxidoreductase [Nocardioides islandensis]|jgi:alkyldihydroxyacetonephosphate synthase|nr:FAD-binding oxidoreductase [Nocardioides islandensis]
MTLEMHPLRWGDPAHATALPDGARALVEAVFGPAPATSAHDATSETELPGALPPPGLSASLLSSLAEVVGEQHVRTDDEIRRLRTRGKSTADLLRARAGDLDDAPDAVVRPGSHDEVAEVLRLAGSHRVAVVPFGGGTCVTGGLAARREGFAGVVSLDLGRLDSLVDVDRTSMTATLQPGLRGPRAEALLAEHGLTIGHFPQSFEHASIGGFAATRSSGQASAGYGRFDALVVGLTVATPTGTLRLGTAPANAAGPDLRQLVLGSEGAFGVITEVKVRVRAVPEVKVYDGWRWASFGDGLAAVRALAQSGLRPTVLRLSDEAESAVNLADPDSIGGGAGGCLMIVGYEGAAGRVDAERAAATALLEGLGGTNAGEEPGRAWEHGRFAAPYLRDSLLDLGVLVETLETATFWSGVDRLYADVKAALERVLGDGGAPVLVLCHVSHVYETGCSLYFTVAARQAGDPVEQWLAAKTAASDAIVAAGATITHHHAVGTDHQPWLSDEIGEVGVRVLRAVKAELDPAGVLNPGVLVPLDGA